MVKTIGGWVQVRNVFVREVKPKEFDVTRISFIDMNGVLAYYENYYNVDLNEVNEGTFSEYGSFDEYLQQGTDEEKAAYTATMAERYDNSVSCETIEEVNRYLKEDKIIAETEIFEEV